MTRENYVGLSLPKPLVDEIDNVVNDKKHGFRSRAEFLKQAAREYLKEFKKQD